MDLIILDTLAATDVSAVAAKIGNALSVVLGLGLVIFFHELGHFMVAKWCDVHVERFSIGIGPILWSRQKGETEYALSALPFGGYVKMLGQDDMDPNQMTSDEIAEDPRSYSAKSVPQRMAIISAGVIMNVITGCLFFALAYRMGLMKTAPVVGDTVTGFPAWSAGLEAGDKITALNGSKVHNFGDIQNEIFLSTGDIRVEGTRRDGTEFDMILTPRQEGTRQIGVIPPLSLNITSRLPDEQQIPVPGLPASRAQPPFLPGDRVTALNGQPLDSFTEMKEMTARLASETLRYSVVRSDAEASTPETSASESSIEIELPPQAMKQVGLWMEMGPIRAVRAGSVAESQGLKAGDRILFVDELEVGKDIDPLRLPNYFADKADQEVKVVVVRQSESSGEQEETLTLTPDSTPGWLEAPRKIDSPLAIPAIGAAYQVLPRIAKVMENSEAADQEEFTFQVGQAVTRVELVQADPQNPVKDVFGDQTSPEVVELKEPEDCDPEDVNWAHVFWMIQQAPERHVRIYVAQEEKIGSALLTAQTPAEDWYMPIRGIGGWEEQANFVQTEGISDSLEMGLRSTRDSGISIYRTLRSLLTGHLAVGNLSGPLGIANIGYQVADRGTSKLMEFLGFLSINLAILNFLPIPVLDGGHMVFLIWEGVTRRKPSARVIGWAHVMGLFFIIGLFVLVFFLDLGRLLGFQG